MTEWFTDAATRCESAHSSPYRSPVQCTRDAHPQGPHESLYTNTAWADQ